MSIASSRLRTILKCQVIKFGKLNKHCTTLEVLQWTETAYVTWSIFEIDSSDYILFLCDKNIPTTSSYLSPTKLFGIFFEQSERILDLIVRIKCFFLNFTIPLVTLFMVKKEAHRDGIQISWVPFKYPYNYIGIVFVCYNGIFPKIWAGHW